MITGVRESAAAEGRAVKAARALRLLEVESRRWTYEAGWVETGAVADALGVSVGEAAASLRLACRLGLCQSRRSLVHGTVWTLSRDGLNVAEVVEP
jgi:hypothetical protein